MLDIEEVFGRILQLDQFHGWDRGDFMLQVFENNYTLAGNGTTNNQAMVYPPGAVIVGMTGGASPGTGASTQTTRPGLDMFTIGLNYQQQMTLVGQSQAIGQALFGQFNTLFPAKEIIIPNNGSLLVSLTNLVSDQITVYLTSHCLVPSKIQ